MTPYKPEEGDEVLVVMQGHVLHVGDKTFQVDEWVHDLAHLRHPGFKILKLSGDG